MRVTTLLLSLGSLSLASSLFTSPTFMWSPMKDVCPNGKEYVTNTISFSNIVETASYIGGFKTEIKHPVLKSMIASSGRPDVISIFLHPNLRTDEVSHFRNSFEHIQHLLNDMPSSVTIPYVSGDASPSTFLESVAASAPSSNFILISNVGLGNFKPAASLSQSVSELDKLIPNNGKVTFIIVNLETYGAYKDTDIKGNVKLVQDITDKVSTLTQDKYVGLFTSFSSFYPHPEIVHQRRVLAAPAGNSTAKTVKVGLYVTSDIMAFLIILGFMIFLYFLGLSSLLNITGPSGKEVQPPPVGREM